MKLLDTKINQFSSYIMRKQQLLNLEKCFLFFKIKDWKIIKIKSCAKFEFRKT